MVNQRAAKVIGDRLGVDWAKIPLEQLRQGIEVEWDEHQDVHHGDVDIAAKIALAHLKEKRDYYNHLAILERHGCKRPPLARLSRRKFVPDPYPELGRPRTLSSKKKRKRVGVPDPHLGEADYRAAGYEAGKRMREK